MSTVSMKKKEGGTKKKERKKKKAQVPSSSSSTLPPPPCVIQTFSDNPQKPSPLLPNPVSSSGIGMPSGSRVNVVSASSGSGPPSPLLVGPSVLSHDLRGPMLNQPAYPPQALSTYQSGWPLLGQQLLPRCSPQQVPPRHFGHQVPPQQMRQQIASQHLGQRVAPPHLAQQMTPRQPVPPQHLGQQMIPQHLMTPQRLGQQSAINPGDEIYPNAHLEVEEESLLPSHSRFRPGMDYAKSSSKGYDVPKKTTKKGNTKEEAIEAINSKTEEIIKELSSKGKFLPENTMRNVVGDLVRKANQKLLHWREISVFSDYSKLHGRVEELIKLYCMCTPITTLHDLGIALAQTEGVGSYEDLHLGPLIKHPKVKDLFKPPDDLDAPPEITLFKLHKHMMRMKEKFRGVQQFVMKDYLELVRKKEGLESIEHLCVRIRSFPLLIQLNSKFRRTQRGQREAIDGKLKIEMEDLLRHEAEQMKRKFSDPRNDDPLSIMKSLSGQNPVDILMKIFEACSQHIGQYQRVRVQDFIQSVMKSSNLRHLFLLAIYKGAYSADKLFPKFFEEPSYGGDMMGSNPQQHMILCKSEGEVFSELLKRLQNLTFPIDMRSLANVEKCVSEQFGVFQFEELGNGPFLKFISEHERLCEEVGGGWMGSSLGLAHAGAVKEKILRIIHQLRHELRSDDDIVSAAITTQFSVTKFQELGCGNVKKLISDSSKESPTQGSNIVHLSPLLMNSELKDVVPPKLPSKSVGMLGHQSKEDALSFLRSAPLLEDLCEWSHWDLLFEPQFGKLSDFLLETSSPNSENCVTALEVHPGVLLRIDLHSSIQDFIAAVGELNSNDAAGHLVSLIVQRGNSKDISPQLLASHVSTSLEKARAAASQGDGTGGGGCKEGEEEEEIARFIFNCLLRIPLKLCVLVAAEIFIDPLRKATSSRTVNTLLKLCVVPSQRQFFQALGMSLGISDWTDDMRVMMDEGKTKIRKETLKAEKSIVHEKGQVPILKEATPDQTIPLMPDLIPPASPKEDAQAAVSGTELPALPSQETGEVLEYTQEEMEEREAECRKVIETIRHEEFGVGIKLEGKQQELAKKQREREGRGIKRLSLELYSKDTHFVLELIQNADDNNYPPHFTEMGYSQTSSFDLPSLKFVIDDQAITVLNNECGFSENNIRAICDVGKSTKGAHRSGYIGQKGIGFKSVFRITDTPSIHSNSFHIRFDASTDPIGFILPHWCEEGDEYTAHIHQVQRWTTKIILPLKESLVASNMARKFNDVRPSLLLFLHRLRSITVEDRVSNTEHHMIRQDKGAGVIDIRHTINSTDVRDRWLLVRKQLDNASRYKPEVDATELAFAFPLPHDQATIVSSKDLQQQQVFAYLPLRSYGFKFIVQADFDLPSSRESVTSDSTWNQWLREGMPALFLEGLDHIKAYANQLAEMTEIDAVALFLQFVPLEGELLDFFQPLTSQIHTLLRGRNCLPTEPLNKKSKNLLFSGAEDSDLHAQGREELEWKQPSQILFVRDKFIREHISQDLLRESLSLSYLHHSLLPYINSSLKSQLSVQSMTIDHLREVAQVALTFHLEGKDEIDSDNEESCSYDYSDDETDGDTDAPPVPPVKATPISSKELLVKWIANWLACVHIVMEESGSESMMVDKLKDLVILPLSGGDFSAAAGNDIFFPPDYKGNDEDDTAQRFEGIYGEMKVLDLSLFEEGEDLVQSRLRKVLELLGVKNLHPIEVIRHHILPQFKENSHKKKNKKIICDYLRYVKDCIERRGSGVTERDVLHVLKDVAVVSTNKGKMLVKDEVIHFSSGYSCRPDIVEMFPDVKWVVIHENYLGKQPTQKDKESWVRFLEKIGIKKGLVVEKVIVKVPKGSERWEELRNQSLKRLPATNLTLRDWQSQELKSIVDSVAGKEGKYQCQQMKKLAELIDSHWDREYTHQIEAQIYDSKNEAYLEASDASSFSKYLVHQAWLPPDILNSNLDFDSQVLFRGSSLFNTNSEDVKRLLHRHAPYVGAHLNSATFLKHLKVQDEITRKNLLEYLVKWSLSSNGDFCTSIDHMISVYYHLLPCDIHGSSGQDDNEIIEEFTEESSTLIFVPKKYYENVLSSQDVEGQFLSVREVCWMDPTSVLYNKQKYNWKDLPRNLPKILSLHYSPHNKRRQLAEEIFCRKLTVRSTPLITTFLAMLKYNSSLSVHPESDHVKDFTSIALHLVEKCQGQTSLSESYIYDNLKDARVFPSQNNDVWVTLRDCLLHNDDAKMAKNFSRSDKVHFIKWPAKLAEKSEEKERFMKLCRIEKLTDKVSTQIDSTYEAKPMEDWKEKLSLWVPLIQKFIYNNCKGQYASLIKDDVVGKLKRLQVLCVSNLKCLYYIDRGVEGRIPSPEPAPRDSELNIDASGIPIIYVTEKKKDKLSCLRIPLMKFFMSGLDESNQTGFRDFLYDLLSDLPKESELVDFEETFELCGVLSTEDEEVWSIPLPVRARVAIESSSEEEEESEGEEVREEVESCVTGIKEEKPLTSWPPRSAADPSDFPHKKHLLPHSNTATKPASKEGMIDEDDLREMRKKLLPDSEEGNEADPDSNQAMPQEDGKRDNTGRFSRNEGKLPDRRSDSTFDRDYKRGTSHSSEGYSQSSTGPPTGEGTRHAGPNSRQHLNQEDHSKDEMPQGSEGMHHRGHHQGGNVASTSAAGVSSGEGDVNEEHEKRQGGHHHHHRLDNSYPRTTWNAMKSAREELPDNELVDIQHITNDAKVEMPLTEFANSDDQESLLRIGRWGEEYVYQVLLRRGALPCGRKIENISWVNQTRETGKPYDIEVKLGGGGGDADGDEIKDDRIYIEVKSTVAENKDLAFFSLNELKFAEKVSSDYHLYRVYNTGKSSSRLCHLENLHKYLCSGPTRLMLLL